MPVHIDEVRVAPPGAALSDVFLHVVTRRAGAVKGESTTPGHEDDIAVQAWSWGVAASSAIGSTAATARRAYRPLVVFKGVDAASTALMSALATNDEVREATLTMRKAGGEAVDYFRMTLSNARVVDVDLDVPPAGLPRERVTIAFTDIEVEYTRQQDGGGGGAASTFSDEVLPA